MLVKAGMHEPQNSTAPTQSQQTIQLGTITMRIQFCARAYTSSPINFHHPTKASPGMIDWPIQQAPVLLPFGVTRSGPSGVKHNRINRCEECHDHPSRHQDIQWTIGPWCLSSTDVCNTPLWAQLGMNYTLDTWSITHATTRCAMWLKSIRYILNWFNKLSQNRYKAVDYNKFYIRY